MCAKTLREGDHEIYHAIAMRGVLNLITFKEGISQILLSLVENPPPQPPSRPLIQAINIDRSPSQPKKQYLVDLVCCPKKFSLALRTDNQRHAYLLNSGHRSVKCKSHRSTLFKVKTKCVSKLS